MRNLKHIDVDHARNCIWALDEQGELWWGEVKTSEDKRRVINWSPVQLPPDGMSFSKPQLSFWERIEREAREKYEASIDRPGETPGMAQEEQTDASGTGAKAEGASDQHLEDGEGTDPDQ